MNIVKILSVLMVVFFTLASCTTADGAAAWKALQDDRVNNGQVAFTPNQGMTGKAIVWARTLAESSGGVCDNARLRHSNLAEGAPPGWQELGENVGCVTGVAPIGNLVPQMQATFMASPAHRANILNPRYNTAGIGMWANPAAGGGNQILVIVVQEFARV